MYSLAILCYPLSKLLDFLLGEHGRTRYTNDQLKYLVNMHSKKALENLEMEEKGGFGLSAVQTKIISGAFDLSETQVGTIVTPINRVFSISIDSTLDQELLADLRIKGYSRVPVYYSDNTHLILGILIVKTLIGLDITQPKTLRELCYEKQIKIKVAAYLEPTTPLGTVLNSFKAGYTHMAIVCDDAKILAEEAELLLDAINKGTD
mmetsp:Transcript_10846/g.8061  ORF Transcript_10846/g.8061 Transcript_10846/m.8061 type:complete len:206 (-) Transcript_10846:782-1399(-)|eukprot:CAMPEP_0202967358 /NCGR_PEP_ID=MMETSP1396-20130829/12193_1 /ASSEMBLY_ACC=CAM_ASM_000872 /TAXON_ID= /ORGANISM="Pseudokeronopsis sp., Strain Brazil" /LENGTH=205 /DNA_ID=CAMNT_0049692315 /DNA_START=541 /DNA_END=1158 /DNA_ORIENTATION=+